jgi:hypothetical protein
VRDLVFSPDGNFFAVTQERQFQVCGWVVGCVGGVVMGGWVWVGE